MKRINLFIVCAVFLFQHTSSNVVSGKNAVTGSTKTFSGLAVTCGVLRWPMVTAGDQQLTGSMNPTIVIWTH